MVKETVHTQNNRHIEIRVIYLCHVITLAVFYLTFNRLCLQVLHHYLASFDNVIFKFKMNMLFCCFFWRNSPQWARASSFMRFLDHTQRRTTVDRTPLDEWSACRRDLYLTSHNTHNRQTSMPPVGIEPTIPASERPQTYALDHAANGTGVAYWIIHWNCDLCVCSPKQAVRKQK